MGVNETCCSNHFTIYTYTNALCYTPKANAMLYVIYISMKTIFLKIRTSSF